MNKIQGYKKHSGKIPSTTSFSQRNLIKMINNQCGKARVHNHITLSQKRLRRYLK